MRPSTKSIGCFVVSFKSKPTADASLSPRSRSKVAHVLLTRHDDGWRSEGVNLVFPSVAALIDRYHKAGVYVHPAPKRK